MVGLFFKLHSSCSENFKCSTKRNPIKSSIPSHVQSTAYSSLGFTINSIMNPSSSLATITPIPSNPTPLHFLHDYTHLLALADLDPETAKLAIGILSPVFSAFSFLFIVRIVMSWYPKLPVGKFPYVLAYAPTEPILVPTRKVIPPLGGVDVTPVVWFALISFMSEILVGPQGLLRLLSQHV
ncbi:hypothetical protein ACHQM5_005077 [Ranunculus cassubicifolius]